MAIPVRYRYQLRCLGPDRLEVEMSDGFGVGSQPLVWFDGGILSLSEPPPPRGIRGLLATRPKPRYTRIEVSVRAWLEVLCIGDLIEIAQEQGRRWVQVTRRGRLELRRGDLRAEMPEAEIVNTFDENGSLEVRGRQGITRVKPGGTAVFDGYRLFLHRLGGSTLGISYLADGWLASDRYSLDWMMATFDKVGETASETA